MLANTPPFFTDTTDMPLHYSFRPRDYLANYGSEGESRRLPLRRG